MIAKYNAKLTPIAQTLRNHMTPEEKHLWYDFLKRLPITVNRQKIIGNYIIDFFIASHRIVIEIDGIQHLTSQGKEADCKRDDDLRQLGFTVLRYSNDAVRNRFNIVCNDILQHLGLSASELKQSKSNKS